MINPNSELALKYSRVDIDLDIDSDVIFEPLGEGTPIEMNFVWN